MALLDSISLYRISCPHCGTLRLVGSLPLTPLAYCPVCRAMMPWDHDLAIPAPLSPPPTPLAYPRRAGRGRGAPSAAKPPAP